MNTTDDSDDGICDSSHCSLREAIRTANETAGPNLITFSANIFPLNGNSMIKLQSALPKLTDSGTIIDANRTSVTVDGSDLITNGFHAGGLEIYNSNNNVIYGLNIQNFPGRALYLNAPDGNVKNNTIINLTLTNIGFTPPPYDPEDGILMEAWRGQLIGNKIINCIINGNNDDGIALDGWDGSTCDKNIIAGNYLANNVEVGIELNATMPNSQANGNMIIYNHVENHFDHTNILISSYESGETNSNIIKWNRINDGKLHGVGIS